MEKNKSRTNTINPGECSPELMFRAAHLQNVDEPAGGGMQIRFIAVNGSHRTAPNQLPHRQHRDRVTFRDRLLAKLHRAVVAALGDPDVQRRVADLGQEIAPPDQQTPQALAAHHRAEMTKWLPMVQAASARPD
jgi:hypothetical protein